MSLSRMIDVGFERIRISKIKKYTYYSGKMYLRNDEELCVVPDKTDGLGFFEKIKYKRLNRECEKVNNKYTTFWKESPFTYVRILMFDGSIYDVCFDQEVKRLYDKTVEVLKLGSSDLYDRRPSDVERAKGSLSSYKSLSFVDYNILKELDMVFNAIK